MCATGSRCASPCINPGAIFRSNTVVCLPRSNRLLSILFLLALKQESGPQSIILIWINHGLLDHRRRQPQGAT